MLKGALTLSCAAIAGGGAVYSGVMMRKEKNERDYYRTLYDGWAGWAQSAYVTNSIRAASYWSNMQVSYSNADMWATWATRTLFGLGAVWLYGVTDGIISAALRSKDKYNRRVQVFTDAASLQFVSSLGSQGIGEYFFELPQSISFQEMGGGSYLHVTDKNTIKEYNLGDIAVSGAGI